MELSLDHRTDLALRAVRLLHAAGDRRPGRELASALGTSVQYLPHVLRPLVRAGWVGARRGPSGGYELLVDTERVSLLDLIELMEGPTEPASCALRGGPCGVDDPCAVHAPWQRARRALLHELATTPATDDPTP